MALSSFGVTRPSYANSSAISSSCGLSPTSHRQPSASRTSSAPSRRYPALLALSALANSRNDPHGVGRRKSIRTSWSVSGPLIRLLATIANPFTRGRRLRLPDLLLKLRFRQHGHSQFLRLRQLAPRLFAGDEEARLLADAARRLAAELRD